MTRKATAKKRHKTAKKMSRKTPISRNAASDAVATPSATAESAESVPDGQDITFQWLVRKHGDKWQSWRAYMAEYVATVHEGRSDTLTALRAFCARYLLAKDLPSDPAWLVDRRHIPPEFFLSDLASRRMIKTNNYVHRFLRWVLETHFSEQDDQGRPVVSPAFHNPIQWRRFGGNSAPSESVRSPLPYCYIRRLREILAPGTCFGDWVWSQKAMGIELDADGRNESAGGMTGDWFEVDPACVDLDDPDCVVRKRVVGGRICLETAKRSHSFETVTEMWSPARSVALLTKLHLPLRTTQVRMLDSGEADTFRYGSNGRTGPERHPLGPGELPPIEWMVNAGPLASGDETHPVQRGVFRRIEDREHRTVLTGLYVNTNKTADAGKEGNAKGYVIPWQHDELFYWLEKLRNWQQKYNPIKAPTKWVDLKTRHFGMVKSPEVIARHADSCFLFRDAPRKGEDRALPMTDCMLAGLWYVLLESLEKEEAATGVTYGDGAPIRFVEPQIADSHHNRTLFPLHSLRVSLLTCLALDGGVPLPVLSKLVAGHSRLIMTLYYIKIGPVRMAEEIATARARLEAKAPESLRRFLAEASLEQLAEKLVALDMDSVRTVLGELPVDRNPAGWALLPEGWCLAGGNTSPMEGNRQVPGCYNGGALVKGHKSVSALRVYAPVHGGSRNCVCCRWFVTAPQFIPRLTVRFNAVSYQLSEATRAALTVESERDAMARERHRTMREGSPWTREAEYLDIEARLEKAFALVDQHGTTLAHAYRLIIRCLTLIENTETKGQQLVAVGDSHTMRAAFKETDSRLLQISQICEDTEIHPDTDPGEAVFVRAQLIDNALMRDGFRPVMLTLTKDQQLKIGNQLLRDLASQFDPDNRDRGMEHVVRAIEAGSSLSEMGLATAVADAIQNATGGPVLRLNELVGPTTAVARPGRRAALPEKIHD